MSQTSISENRIGSVRHILRYGESFERNVQNQINLSALDVDCGQAVKLKLYRGAEDEENHLATYTTQVYDTDTRVTLKQNVVTKHNLNPGEKLTCVVYESYESGESETELEIIDRTTAIEDATASDGLHSGLHSEAVFDYLRENGESQLKYRNVRTQETSQDTAVAYDQPEGYRFSFRKNVRREIKAEPGDLIEIIAPKESTEESENDTHGIPDLSQWDGERRGEKIDIMYKILVELYHEYKEGQE